MIKKQTFINDYLFIRGMGTPPPLYHPLIAKKTVAIETINLLKANTNRSYSSVEIAAHLNSNNHRKIKGYLLILESLGYVGSTRAERGRKLYHYVNDEVFIK